MHSIATWWMWIGFLAFIFFVLTIDLVWLHRKKRPISTSQALTWTMIWIACALVFNFLLWNYLKNTAGIEIANQKALEFFTGYIIEESLSVDNMFVFLMLFHFFRVPRELQGRVLLYGVLGAIFMRLIMILSGTWLVSQFHWVLYLFGLFLVVTGVKMLLFTSDEKDLSENILLVWLRKHLRVTEKFHGEHFFVCLNQMWYVTPLFFALIFIEISDLIFALDSIPAIFSVTNDPFIIFTSNIFAILGLRTLYFLLANMAARFYLLKYAVGLLLIFVGMKMLLDYWIKIPISLTLSVIVTLLGSAVILSGLTRRKKS